MEEVLAVVHAVPVCKRRAAVHHATVALGVPGVEHLRKARSKSAGEKITIRLTDPNDETFSKDHEINIDKIGVVRTEDHSDLIEISENVVVKMRYPDISFFNEGVNTDDISSTTSMIARCVNQIVIEEECITMQICHRVK